MKKYGTPKCSGCLSTTILEYLDEWEEETKSMPGMTSDHKTDHF